MNNDLISREALRKAFHERIWYFDKSSWDEANALIDNAPTVEAFTKEDMAGAYNEGYACGGRESKRPQGEWIYDEDYINHYRCDKCNYHNDDKTNFCPNCGADMRKGGAE